VVKETAEAAAGQELTYEMYEALGAIAGWQKCRFCDRFFDDDMDSHNFRWAHDCGVWRCETSSDREWLDARRTDSRYP
jgi:hypothetical protein